MMKLDRYFTWDIYRGGEKDEEYNSRVEVGHTVDEVFILVQSHQRKLTMLEGFQTQYDKVINFGSEDSDILDTILDYIDQDINTPPGTTISGHLDVEGTVKNHLEDNSEKCFDSIKLEINTDGLHFHPFKNGDYIDNILVPSSTETRNGEKSDENELKHLSSLLENIQSSYSTSRTKSQNEPAQGDLSIKSEKISSKPIEQLIQEGENEKIEFKETFLYDVHCKQPNKELKAEAAKEIAAFANKEGGVILIGVEDESKEVKGLERDFKVMNKGRDTFGIQLQNEISGKLGDMMDAAYTDFEFKEVENGKEICAIWVDKSPEPVYFNGENNDDFFVRTGTSAKPLGIKEATQYINQHWDK